MFDVIVIGAGLGGLMAAAKLSACGKSVLLLEKKMLPGGTSYIFRRSGYSFPMGPLSFSFPNRVRGFLAEAGITEKLAFRRSGFELCSPFLNVILSQPLAGLESDLAEIFPEERAGLGEFFRQLAGAINVSKDMDLWHPDFSFPWADITRERSDSRADPESIAAVRLLSTVPAVRVLDGLIRNEHLKNFLGSMGTGRPEMSMLNLASMWNVMAEEGIWFPACGIHGIADLLVERIQALGGEICLSEPVQRILVRNGRAAGILTSAGQAMESRWVISNADYKSTFLELLDASDIPGVDLDAVRGVPYTGSEFCVYLGIRPGQVDLSAMRTEHLFYRRGIRGGLEPDPEDFDNREIEICLWSGKAPDQAPSDRASLVLRAGFRYGHFERWRLAEKVRREGYPEYKGRLASDLLQTAEYILPGLSGAVEVMESATPLTYRDWGNRYEGSIAGWTWSGPESGRLRGKILVRTPVVGLLAAGIYAAAELFLGGVPTALYTGILAADCVLAE